MDEIMCNLCNMMQSKNAISSNLMRKLHTLHKLHKQLYNINYTHTNPNINYIFSF